MYLEGIFIGGDIRSQLPEEAKKFDQIDKMFKKVRLQILSYAWLLNIFFCINQVVVFVEFDLVFLKICQ